MIDERTLPSNLEAEKAVLGAILIDNSRFQPAADIIDARAFFREAHRRVWNAMAVLSERGSAIDLLTLKDELAGAGELDEVGGPAYIAALTDSVPRAANVEHYAKIVRDAARQRELIRILKKGLDAAFDEWSPGDLSEVVRRELERTAVDGLDDDFKHIGQVYRRDVAPDLEARIARAGTGRTWGVSTGYTDLDALTGGLQPKDLCILAARPSMGKTTLAMNIAQYAAQTSGPVGVFSLEQGAESLFYRMVCSEAAVEWRYVRNGEVNDLELDRLRAAADRIAALPIFINDRADVSAAEIVAGARRLKRQHGLSLFIVDYVQLIHEKGSHGMNRNTELGRISSTLKAGAKELDVPGLVLAQIGREVEKRPNRRPVPSDLRDSGNLEQDADVVMFIHHEDAHDDALLENVVELIVAKQRNGPKGTAKLAFTPEFTRFDNLER